MHKLELTDDELYLVHHLLGGSSNVTISDYIRNTLLSEKHIKYKLLALTRLTTPIYKKTLDIVKAQGKNVYLFCYFDGEKYQVSTEYYSSVDDFCEHNPHAKDVIVIWQSEKIAHTYNFDIKL